MQTAPSPSTATAHCSWEAPAPSPSMSNAPSPSEAEDSTPSQAGGSRAEELQRKLKEAAAMNQALERTATAVSHTVSRRVALGAHVVKKERPQPRAPSASQLELVLGTSSAGKLVLGAVGASSKLIAGVHQMFLKTADLPPDPNHPPAGGSARGEAAATATRQRGDGASKPLGQDGLASTRDGLDGLDGLAPGHAEDPRKASQSQIIKENEVQATSGFEMCLAIGTQHFWCRLWSPA